MGALALAMTLMPSGGARGTRVTTTELAPGVQFIKMRKPKGPWSIRIVDIDLAQPSTIEPVLATGKLPGFETTPRMAKRYGALAAINGDYARSSGRPVMLFAQDGELAQTALTWGVNFAVNESETAAFIKHQEPEMWLHQRDSGVDTEIDKFNAGAPSEKQLAAFSRLGGKDEKPPYGACSARIYPTDTPAHSQRRIGVEQPGMVHQVICKQTRMYPKGGHVISTPPFGAEAPTIMALAPGEDVDLGWSLGWPEVFETIGGNPTLVKNGEIIIEKDGDTAFFNRHPRTGVGFTAENHVLFVTVDGRQPGYSVGMTPFRFAQLFRSLGATYALNLDGGGSTTMVVNNKVVNRPPGGYIRPVSSALLLLPGPDPVPTATPKPVPTTTPTPSPTQLLGRGTAAAPAYPTEQIWLEIARDPASTGGLARWLQHEGITLRGSLARAARIFQGR